MNGLSKIRQSKKMSTEQMASELCITNKEYIRYENNIFTMPLPILKLASLITQCSTAYLLSEVLYE